MKNKIKYLILFFIIGISLLNNTAKGQYMRMGGDKNIATSFFGAESGQGLKIEYNKFLSTKYIVSPALFYHWAKPLQTQYSHIGADIMLGILPFKIGEEFAFFIKGGLTGGYETLKGLQNDISAYSVGVKAGAEIELSVSQSLSLFAYGNQAYLIKKAIESNYYHLGIGLKINLNNY